MEDRGGWQYLCENMGLNLNPSTFEAQCRDQIEARIELAGGYDKALKLASTPRESLPEAMRDVLALAQKTCRQLTQDDSL